MATLVQFTPKFIGLPIDASVEYVWSFGDGTSSTSANPTHTYDPGEYDIVLVANGIERKKTLEVT